MHAYTDDFQVCISSRSQSLELQAHIPKCHQIVITGVSELLAQDWTQRASIPKSVQSPFYCNKCQSHSSKAKTKTLESLLMPLLLSYLNHQEILLALSSKSIQIPPFLTTGLLYLVWVNITFPLDSYKSLLIWSPCIFPCNQSDPFKTEVSSWPCFMQNLLLPTVQYKTKQLMGWRSK